MFNVKEDYAEWKSVIYKFGKCKSDGGNPQEIYKNYLRECNRVSSLVIVNAVCSQMNNSKYLYKELVMGCIHTYRYYDYLVCDKSNKELCSMVMKVMKQAGKEERPSWGDKEAVKVNSKPATFKKVHNA